jgi:type II secretory pathway component GspD/PulD (secretin)
MALHLNRGSVDFDFEDVDLRQALGELFQIMGVESVIYPEVQGTVTVHVRGFTYAHALNALLGDAYTYTIGPHDRVYIHRAGTTWMPGSEKAA